VGGIFGHYEVHELLGQGGMAEVHRAVDISGPFAGRTVAIKRLLPQFARDAEYVELFTSEADLTRMLHHPSIIQVYETGMELEQFYMAMELIDGRNLGMVLRRCRERKILLPVDFAVFLAVTLLDALSYAHTATSPAGRPLGIVHCDISPSNLFVSKTGEVKLGDFGIARVKARDGSEAGAKICGKPYYMSPEIIDGEIEPAADLWASAATIYELLCNERPFTGSTPDEVMAAIRRSEPKPVRALRPEVSEDLSDIVHRGLARERGERYPGAGWFADALRPHLNERIGNPLAIAAVVRGLFGA